jgi:hypothetical protein
MILSTLRRRPPAALAAVLTVAVVAAGCASAEDRDFVDGYNDAVAPLQTTMSSIAASPKGDPAEMSRSLRKLAVAIEDELRTIVES